MRVLITGAGGMLSRAVAEEARQKGWGITALTRSGLDVTDADAVRGCLDRHRPTVVFQGAAYTDVDGAESEGSAADAINAGGASKVARECKRIGAVFVYPSTDYVFSSRASRPIPPAEPPAPLNAYGRSKLAGELAAEQAGEFLIVRTSWLFGDGGKNFVDSILHQARSAKTLAVVNDQFGRPTWSRSLAAIVIRLLEEGARGTSHATGGGPPVSWYEFARFILAETGYSVRVEPIASEAISRPAPRPAYSVLDCSATESIIGSPMPNWREAVREYMREHALVA